MTLVHGGRGAFEYRKHHLESALIKPTFYGDPETKLVTLADFNGISVAYAAVPDYVADEQVLFTGSNITLSGQRADLDSKAKKTVDVNVSEEFRKSVVVREWAGASTNVPKPLSGSCFGELKKYKHNPETFPFAFEKKREWWLQCFLGDVKELTVASTDSGNSDKSISRDTYVSQYHKYKTSDIIEPIKQRKAMQVLRNALLRIREQVINLINRDSEGLKKAEISVDKKYSCTFELRLRKRTGKPLEPLTVSSKRVVNGRDERMEREFLKL